MLDRLTLHKRGGIVSNNKEHQQFSLSPIDREEWCAMLSQRMGRLLPNPSGEQASEAFLREVEEWLTQRFGEMLAHRAEQAFQALYRVDVSEEQVKQVMSTQASALWARAFARMVVARQMEKWETRQRWQAQFAPSEQGDCS